MTVNRYINGHKVSGELPKMTVDNPQVVDIVKSVQKKMTTKDRHKLPQQNQG